MSNTGTVGAGLGRLWPQITRSVSACRFVRCRNATAEVRLRTFLSPCVDDCGPYGQCKLLRTHNYLYAACECKAGERAGAGSGPDRGFLGIRVASKGALRDWEWGQGEHCCLLYPRVPSVLPRQGGGAGVAQTVRMRSPMDSSCCPHSSSA